MVLEIVALGSAERKERVAPSERWTGRTMVPQDHLVDDFYVWLASPSTIFAVSEAVFLRLGCMTCLNAKSCVWHYCRSGAIGMGGLETGRHWACHGFMPVADYCNDNLSL